MAIDWKIVKKIVDSYCDAHPEVDRQAVEKKFKETKKRGY